MLHVFNKHIETMESIGQTGAVLGEDNQSDKSYQVIRN